MLKQLAVFVENKPGSLRKVTTALHGVGISIRAFTSYDTPEFGILRMVVDDSEKAKAELTAQGFVNRICDVIAIELMDEHGAMDTVLASLLDSNINIDYIYSSFSYTEHSSVVIVHTEDILEAENILKRKGFTCMDSLA